MKHYISILHLGTTKQLGNVSLCLKYIRSESCAIQQNPWMNLSRKYVIKDTKDGLYRCRLWDANHSADSGDHISNCKEGKFKGASTFCLIGLFAKKYVQMAAKQAPNSDKLYQVQLRKCMPEGINCYRIKERDIVWSIQLGKKVNCEACSTWPYNFSSVLTSCILSIIVRSSTDDDDFKIINWK